MSFLQRRLTFPSQLCSDTRATSDRDVAWRFGRLYVYWDTNIDYEIVLFPKSLYCKIILQPIDPVNKHYHKHSIIMCATFQGNH